MTETENKEVELGDLKVTFPIKASEQLLVEIQKIIGNCQISRGNIVVILLSLMQLVETYDDITGLQKKALILDSLSSIIDDQIDDFQEAMELKLLVKLTLPTVIDTFISIDKKEAQIKLKKSCGKLLACCGLSSV